MCLDVVLPGHDRAAGGDEARQSGLTHTLKAQDARGGAWYLTANKNAILLKSKIAGDPRINNFNIRVAPVAPQNQAGGDRSVAIP